MTKAQKDWIKFERICLWTDLLEATRSAIRRPDPLRRRSWSIHMDHIVDRIQEADKILGNHVSCREINWDMWPYYEPICDTPLPTEAWEWLEGYLQTEPQNGGDATRQSSAQRVLDQRPS